MPLPPLLAVQSPELATALRQAADAIRASRRILVTTHVNPDGDAVGSALALTLALRESGKTAAIVLADPPPSYCAFLPGIDWISAALPAEIPDLAIVCDAAGLDRIGGVEAMVRQAPTVIEIDHHAVSRPFGGVRIVDDRCYATAALIYDLLVTTGAPITPAIATCLLMGTVTDTGAFRFTNTSPGALRLSAALMEAGGSLDQIIDQVYDQKPISSLRLLEQALSHLRVEGGFASATLSKAEFAAAGAQTEESEGIVNHLRSLKGIQVAALLREAGAGEVRVSLRGRPGVNVAVIAALFGGGGHAAAAGCTLRLPLTEAEAELREKALTALRNQAPPTAVSDGF